MDSEKNGPNDDKRPSSSNNPPISQNEGQETKKASIPREDNVDEAKNDKRPSSGSNNPRRTPNEGKEVQKATLSTENEENKIPSTSIRPQGRQQNDGKEVRKINNIPKDDAAIGDTRGKRRSILNEGKEQRKTVHLNEEKNTDDDKRTSISSDPPLDSLNEGNKVKITGILKHAAAANNERKDTPNDKRQSGSTNTSSSQPSEGSEVKRTSNPKEDANATEMDATKDKRSSAGSNARSSQDEGKERKESIPKGDNTEKGIEVRDKRLSIGSKPQSNQNEGKEARNSNKFGKDLNNDVWKKDIRMAIRESQQLFAPTPTVNPLPESSPYYRLIVKVPRVTKSYYDRLEDEKQRLNEGRRGHSDSMLINPQCIPERDTHHTKKPVTKSQASANLLAKRSKRVVQKRPPPTLVDEHEKGEILNYFDPDMVQFEYQQLLPKSRNIVIGPPREILRDYFGYGKDDPLPPELQHDNTPKAFILPKHLWRDFDDTNKKYDDKTNEFSKAEGKQAKDQLKRGARNQNLLDSQGRKIQKGEKVPLSKPSPLDLFIRPLQQKLIQNPEIDEHAIPFRKIHAVMDENSPRYYETERTKCERKRRREIDDDDIRKKPSEYEVVCGSGISSVTLIVAEEDAQQVPEQNRPRLQGVDSAPAFQPLLNRTQRRRSSLPNFVNREGSDLSLELGPDPMQRLPRDALKQYQYYRSYPMYPTISNERFYEWYKDLERLNDPCIPKKPMRPAGVSKSSPETTEWTETIRHPSSRSLRRTRTQTGSHQPTTRSSYQPRRRTNDESKPERPDFNTRDYVYDNARSIMIMPAKRVIPRYVDDRNGTVHLLEPSGLTHKYVKRNDFGRIPEYLPCRNEEQGRPPLPDFNKFYRFHRCKFVHGHVHCKRCNATHQVNEGSGDWECCNENDAAGTGSDKYNGTSLCGTSEEETYAERPGGGDGQTAKSGQSSSKRGNSKSGKNNQSSDSNYKENRNQQKPVTNIIREKEAATNYRPPMHKDVQYIVNMMNELAVEHDTRNVFVKYAIPKVKNDCDSSSEYTRENGNFWESVQNSYILSSPPSFSINGNLVSRQDTGKFSFISRSNSSLYSQ